MQNIKTVWEKEAVALVRREAKKVAKRIVREYKLGKDWQSEMESEGFIKGVDIISKKPQLKNNHVYLFMDMYRALQAILEKKVKGYSNDPKYERKKGRKAPKTVSSVKMTFEDGVSMYYEDESVYDLKDSKRKEELIDVFLTIKWQLMKMPEKQQRILAMVWQGYSHKEISKALNISHKTIYNTKNKFKESLYRLFPQGLGL